MQTVTSELAQSIQLSQQDILQNQEQLRLQLTESTDRLDAKLNQSLENNEQLLQEQARALANQETLLNVSSNVAATVKQARAGHGFLGHGVLDLMHQRRRRPGFLGTF
jgi:hypothetical protein